MTPEAQAVFAKRIEKSVRPEVRELCAQVKQVKGRLSEILAEGATLAEIAMVVAACG